MDRDNSKELMELLNSAKAGDDDAFSKLVEQYEPMFNGIMHNYSLDERDVFTELCLGFRKAIRTYDVSRGTTFGLYAKICVDRVAKSVLRRLYKEREHAVDQDVDVDNIAVSGGIQAVLEHRERSAYFLSVAKAVLSDLELKVYRYWMLGYTTAETASDLGVSAKTVDNAKNRMWKKLRSHLTPED